MLSDGACGGTHLSIFTPPSARSVIIHVWSPFQGLGLSGTQTTALLTLIQLSDGLYSLLTACSRCDLWLVVLRLEISLQAQELPRIGWADNTSLLSDHNLAALNYRVAHVVFIRPQSQALTRRS